MNIFFAGLKAAMDDPAGLFMAWDHASLMWWRKRNEDCAEEWTARAEWRINCNRCVSFDRSCSCHWLIDLIDRVLAFDWLIDWWDRSLFLAALDWLIVCLCLIDGLIDWRAVYDCPHSFLQTSFLSGRFKLLAASNVFSSFHSTFSHRIIDLGLVHIP